MAQVSDYTDKVTSEYKNSTNFLAMIEAVTQAFVDNQNLLASLPTKFDLDVAIGAQLDAVGVRVGRSRYLQVPLPNVFFSFDIAGVGWDEGVWYEPFNPTSGLTRLPDDEYRVLLYAVIAANQWDGSIQGAYAAYSLLFDSFGYKILIQDNGDMTMLLAIVGEATIPAVVLALFTTGELDLKPDGVRIAGHVTPTVPDTPFFGFDVENPSIAGWDTGAWGNVFLPE